MTAISEPIQAGALGLVAGLVYGGVWFMRARAKDDEPFDPSKFGATLLVGALVGASLGIANQEVTQSGIETQLVAYAGLITLVEGVIKTIREESRP